MAESAVKIAVRERPLKDEETIIEYSSSLKNILIANDRPFAFDYIFQSNVLQKEIFDALAQPLVKKTIEGYNCNIFAYGQTGTGKTYTMGLTQNLENECAGIIPRCLHEVFSVNENILTCKIYVSYIEIYNEKVFDMLSFNPSMQVNVKGFKFNGGTKHEAKSADEGLKFLIQGNQNRHVRPTKMNSQSSRSHAIFTIHVEKNTDSISVTSMLNLIDLAGSEGVRRTGHQGIALSEGVNINQGLLSVGKVIQALNSGSKVIPYRDSILTSVLQESLNSNSYLTLLACISSEKIDKTETLSTLRFAQNVKSLRNNPLINSIFLEYQNIKKQKTPSKTITPLRSKNIYTPLSKKKNVRSINAIKRFNSFCSPSNIRRVEVKRLNSTEIKKVRHPYFKEMCTQQEFKNSKKNLGELNNKLSIESRSSFTSLLNASSSTILELPISSTNSPNGQGMVEVENLNSKKHVENFFDSLEQVAEKESIKYVRENDIIETLPPQIYTNLIWDSVKNNLRDMLREELLLTFEKEREINIKDLPQEKNYENLKSCDNTTEYNRINQKSSPIVQSSIPNSKITPKSNQNLNSSLIWNSMENNIRELIKKELITLVDDKEILKTPRQNQIINEPKQDFNFKVPIPISNFENQGMESIGKFSTPQESLTYQSRRSRRLSRHPTIEENQVMEPLSKFNTSQESITYQPRRSRRLSRRPTIEDEIELSSTLYSISESLIHSKTERRISKRITINSEEKNLRRSLRIETKNFEKQCSLIEDQKYESKFESRNKTKKTTNNLFSTNKVISSYFSKGIANEIPKTSKTKHQKAVLDLLNNGTIKELQILPYIGLKTAYQIITHRTLNGKFKSFDVVSKLPVWRGKSWDRFKEANSL